MRSIRGRRRRSGALGITRPTFRASHRALARVAAEADRFVAQVVDGLDAAHAAAFGAHEDRVRDRAVALDAHAAEQGAVAVGPIFSGE